LAEWVGVDREIVAQAIGQLGRDGVLERKHRHFVIKDHARLLRLAEQ
jgi:DNA-binding GntR family transcriptional regulator